MKNKKPYIQTINWNKNIQVILQEDIDKTCLIIDVFNRNSNTLIDSVIVHYEDVE
jgi:hypothetical protein